MAFNMAELVEGFTAIAEDDTAIEVRVVGTEIQRGRPAITVEVVEGNQSRRLVVTWDEDTVATNARRLGYRPTESLGDQWLGYYLGLRLIEDLLTKEVESPHLLT